MFIAQKVNLKLSKASFVSNFNSGQCLCKLDKYQQCFNQEIHVGLV